MIPDRVLAGRDRLEIPTVAAVLVVLFGLYLALGNLNQLAVLPFDLPHFSAFPPKHAAAARIARGELLYRDHVRYGANVYHYPPVFLYAVGAVYRLVGVRVVAGKAVLALATVLCGAVLFVLADDVFDRRTARVATGLFLANPVTLVAAYASYFDPFVVFFALASLAALVRGRPGASGGLLALGVLSKPFPAVLLPLAAAYCVETDDASLPRFLLGFLVVGAAVSAPFLLLAPEAYVHYAFAFNFERPTASLSLYYYFFPRLESTLAPVVLPAGFVTAFTAFAYGTYRSHIAPATILVGGAAGLFLGFLLLNRINYPHYLLYVVPFFSVVLADAYCSGRTVRGRVLWRDLAGAFGAVLLGAAVWSYPWLQGVERLGVGHFDFKASPYFWLGSGIYFFAGFVLLGVLVAWVIRSGVTDFGLFAGRPGENQ